MSLFNWFGKSKKEPPATAPRSSSGLAHLDATLPNTPAARPIAPAVPSSRKQERHAMRELLYTVVRESMNKMGVLSSSYKFKVLSLDSRGRQYLVMMDLQRLQTGEVARMAEIETLIAQSAKARHDILVTAVYWRINEHVTAGLSHPAATPSKPAPLQATATAAAVATPAQATPAARPNFEPLHPDEVVAFKQALASVHTPLVQPGEIVQSGRRNPAPPPDFHDTEIDEGPSPLSGTQYGDLN